MERIEFVCNGHDFSYDIRAERIVTVYDAKGKPLARAEFDHAVENVFGDMVEDGEWVEYYLPSGFYFEFRENFTNAAYWIANDFIG